MNKGYRLSSSQALANYYADTRNYASFGRLDGLKELGKKGLQAAKGVGQNIDEAAQMVGGGVGNAARNSSDAVRMQAARLPGMQRASGRNLVAPKSSLSQDLPATVRNRRRMLGYGTAVGATGLVGAGGYAGYRALRGEDEQY